MNNPKKYMVLISKNALLDINENHHYILTTFKYHVYADNFSNKIKKALKSLEYFPTAYEKTGYTINNLDIYIKPYQSYLIFFAIEDTTVTIIRILKDRRQWKSIIKRKTTLFSFYSL